MERESISSQDKYMKKSQTEQVPVKFFETHKLSIEMAAHDSWYVPSQHSDIKDPTPDSEN